jgi:tetratricopeptide (TPR) repeat protein
MKDSFLYRVLNKALRTQNIDLLCLFRFFIHDMRHAIKKNICTSPIRVYRSQLMTKEQVNMLEKSIGDLVSINSFLSTSIYRELALLFLKQSSPPNDLEQVLFEIHADPSMAVLKPFGFIESNSNVRKTEEVLFTLGSVFRLINIQKQEGGLWTIQMALCKDNDQQLKAIFKPFKANHKGGRINLLSLGNLLRKMDKLNEAEKFYMRLLHELPYNYPDIADCYYSLACIGMGKKMYDQSLEWHQKSLEIKLHTLKEDNLSIADSYNSIGEIHLTRKDYQQAISAYFRALKTFLQVNGDNHPTVATCYTDIGGIYQKQEKYTGALECYQKALAIRQKNFSVDHPDLGISHNNIAIIYSCLGQFDLALQHYNIALKILQNILPPLHPEIAVSYCGLGLIYEQKDQLDKALSHYEKAAIIYRQALSSSHPDVIQIEQHMQRISSKLRS